MNMKIYKGTACYELEFLQITQLCGTDFSKKDFILDSIQKYFSNARYTEYEKKLWGNVLIGGEQVGRKYFTCHSIENRTDLIKKIGMGKTGLVMEYLFEAVREFACQKELDSIVEHLEKLYLQLNQEMSICVNNIELSYEPKNLLEIIQTSQIKTKAGGNLEELSNYELLITYMELLAEREKKQSEKMLIIIKDIDHLLEYQEYCMFFEKIRNMFKNLNVWLIFSTSIDGFVMLEKEFIKAVNVINDVIYSMPEEEKIMEFVRENYPCEKNLELYAVMEGIRCIIQKIGKGKCKFNIMSAVFLKLINASLCIDSVMQEGINQLENAFLMSKNMV